MGPPGVVELVVEIDPRIDGADDLVTWVDEEGTAAIAQLPPDPRRDGVVHVVIEGALYDYEITMTPLREGQLTGAPRTWECECTNEELLERMKRELLETANRLGQLHGSVVIR